MSISITIEDKNSLSITNDSKGNDKTWADATETWDEAVYTWETTGAIVIAKDVKNTLNISNENKN